VAPARFGDYELLGKIAQGGMGVVYRARQVSLNRVVALKMILRADQASAEAIQRFRSEAEAVASLDHPHIVPIHEVGERDGLPFFSMKLVTGGSLAQKISGLEPRASARLLVKVSRAVHHAHQRGILHRDLKPGNVLLDEAGEPHVTDFGLAKRVADSHELTQSGAVMGTPSYMPPEQATGRKHLTVAADVYAVGAILYECLSGRPPFKSETPLDTLLRVVTDEPVPPRQHNPAVPRDLETIALKCLEKEPHKRYGSAAELADDLERYLAGEAIRARPVGSVERALKWARRQPLVAALVAAVVLVAAAGLAGIIWKYRDAEHQKKLAQDEAERARKQEEIVREQKRIVQEERDRAREHETRAIGQGKLAEQRRVDADALRVRAQTGEKRAQEQVEVTRRALYGAQLMRVGVLWDRDPILAAELLDDPEICPPELRDFSWGLYRRLCRWDRRRLPGPVSCLEVSPDGKTLALGGQGTIRLYDVVAGRERSFGTWLNGYVSQLAFSGDGTRLASAGPDGMVRLWDVRSGKLVRPPLKAPSGDYHNLAFSRDGTMVAAASGALDPKEPNRDRREKHGYLVVWEVATGKEHTLIRDAGSSLHGVCFSPDSKTVAAGFTNAAHVTLFDVPSGKHQGVTPMLGGWTHGIAFSPDGKLMAVGCASQRIHLFDPKSRRIVRELRGHTNDVTAVAFSPDGTHLISGSDSETDGTVRVWHVATGRERAVLRHTEGIGTVAFCREGRALAVLTARGVHLWQLPAGPQRVTFAGNTRGIHAYSPDGQFLAANSSLNNDVVLYDPQTGRELANLGRMGGAIAVLAFNPDGGTLAAGSADGSVAVMDVATRTRRTTLRAADGEVLSLAFLPGGRAIAAGTSRGIVKVHDLAAKKARLLRPESGGPITALAVSRDGRALVLGQGGTKGENGTIELWDVEAGRRLANVPSGDREARSLTFTPDGRTVASAHEGAAYAWEAPSLRKRATFPGGAQAVAFHPDGRALAVGLGSPDDSVQVWEVTTRQLHATLPGFTRGVTCVAFSADGQALLAASGLRRQGWWVSAGEMVRWSVTPDRTLAGWTMRGGAVRAVACTPDGRTLAAGGESGQVKLWDLRTRQTLPALAGHAGAVWCLAMSADGKTLASGGKDNSIRLWDLDRRELRAVLRVEPLDKPAPPAPAVHWGCPHVLAFSPDGRWLASGGCDRTVRLWDLPADGPRERLLGRHATGVGAVAFSPDGCVLVSAGAVLEGKRLRGEIKMWDVASGKEKQALVGHEGMIHSLAFSPDGALLASGGADRVVWLWQVATGKPLGALRGHTGSVHEVAFTADGKRLVSVGGAAAGEVKVHDVAARQEVADLPGHDDDVTCLAMPREGGLLVTGSSDGTVKVWQLPQDPVPAWVAAVARLNGLLDGGAGKAADHAERARVLAAAGKRSDALDDYARVVALGAKDQAMLRESALVLESAGRWEEAAAAYTAALARPGEAWMLRGERLRVNRRLGRWRELSIDLGKELEKRPADLDLATQLAYALLLCEDRSRHREVALRALAQHGQTKDARAAAMLARLLVLVPLGPRATEEGVRLARLGLTGSTPWQRHVLGLALCRAGKHEQAADAFRESLKAGNWGAPVNWLGLALAEKGLGRDKEAREWLGKATDALDRALRDIPATAPAPPSLHPHEWLEALLLRREAEAALAARPSP
jgi:WD40 repeat protein/tetratricopeptide (TPR) repeat protein